MNCVGFGIVYATFAVQIFWVADDLGGLGWLSNFSNKSDLRLHSPGNNERFWIDGNSSGIPKKDHDMDLWSIPM